MRIKNKLMAVGFVLAFANLGSVTAKASHSGLSTNGEFVTISAQSSGKVFFRSDDDSDYQAIYKNSREKLKENAVEACSGRHFNIDESSIKQTDTRQGNWEFMILTVTSTARAFCIGNEK